MRRHFVSLTLIALVLTAVSTNVARASDDMPNNILRFGLAWVVPGGDPTTLQNGNTFEPNDGYARFASEVLGLPVTHGFYQNVRIKPESQQDIVTAFHVVEHLESPYDALMQVRGWLQPSGQLMVEVPNVEAVCQWPHS